MENIQAVITQQAGKIECNFEQVEKGIQERLKEYEGAVFTEDSKVYAKKEVASLRAEQQNLKDNLRDAKKTYMAPWDAFESRAKGLIALYDKPIGLINGQVKEFEAKRLAEKKQLIERIYLETAIGLKEYIPLEKIYNPKWENATTREKAIREEMRSLADSTRQALETIHGMHSEVEEDALRAYKSSLSLADAVACINNYERQRQDILAQEKERQRREEAERIRQEERERIAAEQRAQAEKEAAVREAEAAAMRQAEEERAAAVEEARAEAAQEVVDNLIPELEGQTSAYEYQMQLTKDAKEKLEMYLDSVGIEYEVEEITGWQM